MNIFVIFLATMVAMATGTPRYDGRGIGTINGMAGGVPYGTGGGAIGGSMGYMGGPYSYGMMGGMGYGMGGMGRRRGWLHCKCREWCVWFEFQLGKCWWCTSPWCRKRCCRWI